MEVYLIAESSRNINLFCCPQNKRPDARMPEENSFMCPDFFFSFPLGFFNQYIKLTC